METKREYRPRFKGYRTCIEDGVVFNATRKDARFCSPACRQAHSRRNRFIATLKGIPVTEVASARQSKPLTDAPVVDFWTGVPKLPPATSPASRSTSSTRPSSSTTSTRSTGPALPPAEFRDTFTALSQKSALVPMPAISAAKVSRRKSVTPRPHTSKSVTPGVRGKKTVTTSKGGSQKKTSKKTSKKSVTAKKRK